MGSSESRLSSESSPTPVDQPGAFAVKIGDGLVDNMTGAAAAAAAAAAQGAAGAVEPGWGGGGEVGGGGGGEVGGGGDRGLEGVRRMPAVPDTDMLQRAYDEGARDMKENLDREVERRVHEQLSLRARMQAARAREEKARQEHALVERTLSDALADEEADQRKLNEYTESLFNRQYQTPSNPLRCVDERAACLSCYEQAGAEARTPLDCAKYVDAFVQCSNDQKEFVSRGRPTP